MRRRRRGDVHGAPCVASRKGGLRVTGGRVEVRGEGRGEGRGKGRGEGEGGEGEEAGCEFVPPCGREHAARHRSGRARACLGARGKTGPRATRRLDPRICALQRHALASPQRLSSNNLRLIQPAAHCASDVPPTPDHSTGPVSSSDSRRALVSTFARAGSHRSTPALPPTSGADSNVFRLA